MNAQTDIIACGPIFDLAGEDVCAWTLISRRHSPYTEIPYKGSLSFRLIYCIQIEFICHTAFYVLKDGVQKEIERNFYDIEGIFDGFGQPGK